MLLDRGSMQTSGTGHEVAYGAPIPFAGAVLAAISLALGVAYALASITS